MGDIRNRVSVAKMLSRNKGEFMRFLELMEVEVSENSIHAPREDWIFSLADQPSRKASGERLGMTFGKIALTERFERMGPHHPDVASSRAILSMATDAVELNDLAELERLAKAMKTDTHFSIGSSADCGKRIETLQKRMKREPKAKAAAKCAGRIEELNQPGSMRQSASWPPKGRRETPSGTTMPGVNNMRSPMAGRTGPRGPLKAPLGQGSATEKGNKEDEADEGSVKYRDGRLNVFDTDSCTQSQPFGGSCMLADYEVRFDQLEKGLWLQTHFYETDQRFKEDLDDGIVPAGRRAMGWRLLLAEAGELEEVEQVLVDSVNVLVRIGGSLLDAMRLDCASALLLSDGGGPPLASKLQGVVDSLSASDDAMDDETAAKLVGASWEAPARARELQSLQQVEADNEEEGWMEYEGDWTAHQSRAQTLQAANQGRVQVHAIWDVYRGDRESLNHSVSKV